MTKLKIEGNPAHAAVRGLEAHVAPLYAKLGRTVVAVVELRSVERTQVDATSGKDPAVKARITSCEVATGKSDDHVRDLMAALHTLRTASGEVNESTLALDFDRSIDLAENTARQAAGLVMVEENARLMVGLRHVAGKLRDLAGRDLSKTTPTKYRDEVTDLSRLVWGIVDAVDTADASA